MVSLLASSPVWASKTGLARTQAKPWSTTQTNQNGNLLRKFSALSTPYDVVQFRREPVHRCKINFAKS